MRNGEEKVIHFDNIVVGDVVKIKGGMNIPVDGVIIKSSGVQTDEAAMTGESDELKKETIVVCQVKKEELESENKLVGNVQKTPHDIPSPVILSGTQVATGEGWFLVIMVGKNSCVGKIFGKLEITLETTPLQEKLEKIGSDIGKVGMIVALCTIHILFLRFFIEGTARRSVDFFGGDEDPRGDKLEDYVSEWVHYLIIGITIIVVSVPEGLPLAVMISLAYSVRKMLID